MLAWGVGGEAGAGQVSRTQLGVLGEPSRFASLTGQSSTIRHSFIGWHQPNTLRKLLDQLKPVPMVAIKTGGVVTPLGIAQGKGDGFLIELNSALAGFGAPVYVRPMPEMNGHCNEYAAFNRDGSSRGPQYSTAAFRKAFARIALIARGGPALREPEHQRELRRGLLPGQRVRRRRCQRSLRPAAFVKGHDRIEFLVYFSGRPGSIWDLASKPRSRAVYRRVITPLGR